MGLSGAVSTHRDTDSASCPDKDKMALACFSALDNSGRLQAALFSNAPTNTVNLLLHFALLNCLTCICMFVFTFSVHLTCSSQIITRKQEVKGQEYTICE